MDEEIDRMFGNMVKQMSTSKSFATKNEFYAILKEAVSKIEITKDFDKLDVVISSKEHRWSINYANYFSRLIKPLNQYCCFNFYYNFVKKLIAEESVLRCSTLKPDVQWMDVREDYNPVTSKWESSNYLTVLFQGDVCHLVGGIQARRITHNEKKKIQSQFIADSKLKPSTLYRKKIADIENRSFAGGNRTGIGRSLKSF